MEEYSFRYKGKTYQHHSRLPLWETAWQRFSFLQSIIFLLLLAGIAMCFYLNWRTSLIVTMLVVTLCYFADLLFDFFVICRSFMKGREIHVSKEEMKKVIDIMWPKYTILCPLYKEAQILPQFLTGIENLDYPKEQLQVLLLLEEDDKDTIAYVTSAQLPSYVTTLVVPQSLPKTKPKACNYALSFTIGDYVVIFDAEDIPDPKQLKKAVLAFAKSDEKVACIQAKLNYYNSHQNILTRLFTSEYSLWFDLFLPGLQSIRAPIPLGGTSNHFRTSQLKELKGWDSFNVAEDADLGMRLAKYGYKTAIVDSTTMEEANSNVFSWIRQRSRWMKGYIQTYFVFMRKPLTRKTSLITPFFAQLILAGRVLSALINPIMWGTTIIYFLFQRQSSGFIHMLFPSWVFYLGIISFLFGNFLYTYYYLIGIIKRKNWSLALFTPFVPLYWLLISLATIVAVIEIVVKPHHWHKTAHGLHLQSTPSVPNVRFAL